MISTSPRADLRADAMVAAGAVTVAGSAMASIFLSMPAFLVVSRRSHSWLRGRRGLLRRGLGLGLGLSARRRSGRSRRLLLLRRIRFLPEIFPRRRVNVRSSAWRRQSCRTNFSDRRRTSSAACHLASWGFGFWPARRSLRSRAFCYSHAAGNFVLGLPYFPGSRRCPPARGPSPLLGLLPYDVR